MITRQKKTDCNNHDATQKMITINYVLKEKNTVFVHENIVWKIELMNENVYAMSDIGHKMYVANITTY